MRSARADFLGIPPFPGAMRDRLACASGQEAAEDATAILGSIASARVGGRYWGSQPDLPFRDYTLVSVRNAREREAIVDRSAGSVVIRGAVRPKLRDDNRALTVNSGCDPWHLIARASSAVVDADDDLALIAAIAGVPVEIIGEGRFAALNGEPPRAAVAEVLHERVLAGLRYVDPFTDEAINVYAAIRHCAFWRELIDRNRSLVAAIGFAHWKRATVAPLLWPGHRLPFRSAAIGIASASTVAIWRSRCSATVLREIEAKQCRIIEVEDGFIRSSGLGADCVPPLSIVADDRGAHFDPGEASDLEQMLSDAEFDSGLLQRAGRLRELIVAAGLSKYGAGAADAPKPRSTRQQILVTGQVEDDRSVACGGGDVRTNLELLRRVRADRPDAEILFKPHPDVEAGHRVGAIPDGTALRYADQIVRDTSITALFDRADELHVLTSLAGFEALLRGKPVTTHGVPFYAGWGLTRDLGHVPERRGRQRTIDELVAAVLLLYPRYLDPISGLPCPAEILIRRLSATTERKPQAGMLVQLRRLQGRGKKLLAANR